MIFDVDFIEIVVYVDVMMSTTSIEYLRGRRSWEGGIENLCYEAERFLAAHPHFDPDWSPTARLIRAYATQKIISLPERIGRDAHYRFHHLLELLSARALIAGGMKLEKVQAQLQGATEEERLQLIERRLLDVAAIRTDIAADPLLVDGPDEELGPDRPLARAADRAKALAEAMRRLEPDPKKTRPRPVFKTMTRLAITEWCHLLIGRQELRHLTPEQARDIGFAVAAALMDPDIRRGAGGAATKDSSESGDSPSED